jgi:thioredoxin 1
VCKINVDDNRELAMSLGVKNIPTILLFKDGKIVDKIVGITTLEKIIEKAKI